MPLDCITGIRCFKRKLATHFFGGKSADRGWIQIQVATLDSPNPVPLAPRPSRFDCESQHKGTDPPAADLPLLKAAHSCRRAQKIF